MSNPNTRQHLHLSIILMFRESEIARGSFLVSPLEVVVCLGEVQNVFLPKLGTGNDAIVQMVSGLVVRHRTDEKGAALGLKLFEIVNTDEGPKQQFIFHSATRIPPECETIDFESMQLSDDIELHYRTRWLD